MWGEISATEAMGVLRAATQPIDWSFSQHKGLTKDTCTTGSNGAAVQRANSPSVFKHFPELVPFTLQPRQNNGHGKKKKWDANAKQHHLVT